MLVPRQSVKVGLVLPNADYCEFSLFSKFGTCMAVSLHHSNYRFLCGKDSKVLLKFIYLFIFCLPDPILYLLGRSTKIENLFGAFVWELFSLSSLVAVGTMVSGGPEQSWPPSRQLSNGTRVYFKMIIRHTCLIPISHFHFQFALLFLWDWQHW
jgi:hypothetical protein